MSKSVLFIEDYWNDFKQFSIIMSNNGFRVYPQISDIGNQTGLYAFLHNNTNRYNELKNNIFNYIIKQELYDKISLIVLDINLLGKDNGNSDESGTTLLSDFRNDFYSFFKNKKGDNPIYENWSKSIPVIALTIYDKEKRNKFKQRHGNLADALNKQEVANDGDENILISALNTAETNKDNIEKNAQAKQKQSEIHNHYDNIKTGDNSPVIIGSSNTVQSYNDNVIKLRNEIINNYKVTQPDADELVQILQEEKQKPDNNTLISKMKNWWNKVKSYVRDLSIEVLGGLLSSLLLPETITLIKNAIQG